MPQQIYLLSIVARNRTSVFTNHLAARAACRRFEDSCLLADAKMLAWVLMPDHAHWLLQLGHAKSLQKTVESLKAFSALDANIALGRVGPVWARGYHDHALRREQDLRAVSRYVVANPVRAGLVQHVADYPYWNSVFL